MSAHLNWIFPPTVPKVFCRGEWREVYPDGSHLRCSGCDEDVTERLSPRTVERVLASADRDR